MLNFRTKEGRAASRPPNYLGHRFQRPWIIGLFVIAGGLWLLRGGDPGKLTGFIDRGAAAQSNVADGNIKDNVLEKKPTIVGPGEVKAVGPRPENPVEGKRLFHNVSPKLFTTLQDDEVHRFDEQKSFFTLLKTLQDADERDIELASAGRRNFRQLFEQTDEYRGEIVTVAGLVQRIIPAQANDNPQGIKKFYEVWIQPTGSRLPIAIDCLEIPKDYPIGVPQYVEATGFYYKRLGYPSEPDPRTKKDVYRSAPVLLTKTLRWTPQAGPQAELAQAGDAAMADIPGMPKGIPVKWLMPILGVGIVIMIVLAVWSFRLSRTSVLDRNGPIVGRARRAAEAAQAPQNLNNLKIDP